MVKSILVSLNNFKLFDDVMAVAGHLAERFGAHVTGLYAIPAPTFYPAPGPGTPVIRNDSLTHVYTKHLGEMKTKFDDFISRNGLTGEWRVSDHDSAHIEDAINHAALFHDLIIVPHEITRDIMVGYESGLASNIISGSGRPVLIVPPGSGETFNLEQIAVAWKDSKEAARAVFDALSLLKASDQTHLVWVNPEKDEEAGDVPGAELAEALDRHGVNVTTHGLSHCNKVAQVLLDFADDKECGLLVMGAYGHSRLRQVLLGGVTHYMFRHTARPILMSS